MRFAYRISAKQERIPQLGSGAPWFLRLEPFDNAAALEDWLLRPDSDGWIHSIADSPEKPSVVIDRARRFPERISVVAAPMPVLVDDFLETISEPESLLFVYVPKFDALVHVIRRAMSLRPPYSTTAAIALHLFPTRKRADPELADLLNHLFIDQELKFSMDSMLENNTSAHHRCWERVRSRGIKNLREIHSAIYVIRAAHFLIEHKLSPEEAAACCDSHRDTLKRHLTRVLGVRSVEEAVALGMTEIVTRAFRYMLIDGSALSPPESVINPVRQRERERERERESREIRPRRARVIKAQIEMGRREPARNLLRKTRNLLLLTPCTASMHSQ